VVPAAPRSIVFYAGDNDLGDGQMPDAVLSSLHLLQQKIAAQLGETPFAFVSIKPSIQRFGIIDRINAVNAGAQRLLAERPQSFTSTSRHRPCRTTAHRGLPVRR
jgi:hypothetical protein